MIFSSIATVIYKSQGNRIKPGLMLVIQTTVSAIAFQIINASMGNFREMFKIPVNAFIAFVFAAILGIVIGNFIYLISLNLIGVSKAYPIAMTYPLLTYLLEIMFLGGIFNWMKFLGIISVIVGVIFISISKINENNNLNELKNEINEKEKEISDIESSDVDHRNFMTKINTNKTLLGIILALLTAITWASGTTLIKYALNQTEVDIIPINSARMIFLVPFALTLFFITRKKNNVEKKITGKSVSLVALGSLFGLVIANIVYLMALDSVGTSTTAAIAASGPLISTPLSILFLKEKIDWEIIKGTILTIIGNILVILLA